MDTIEPWIVLAHLLRPQGRKGELLADLHTDFPEQLRDHPGVWLAKPDFSGPRSDARAAKVTDFFLPVGRNAGRIVLQLDGTGSIEDAERLAGLDVLIPEADRPPLDDDAAYVGDLVGCTVYDGDVALGVVAEVQFATSSSGARLEDAAPLLCVTGAGEADILIPFAREYLVEMDIAGKAIRMALPEGLADLNR